MGRLSPDFNDYIVWNLTETSGPYRNTGVFSPNNASTDLIVANTIDRNGTGLEGTPAANFPGTDTFPIGASATRNYAVGASSFNLQPPLTVSAWVHLRNFQTSSNKHIIGKLFRDHTTTNNWATPFCALELTMATGNSGMDLFFGVVSRPFIQTSFTIIDFPLPIGQWAHIGFSHDGTNLTAFLNGSQLMTYSGTTQNLVTPAGGNQIFYSDSSYSITNTTGTYTPGIDDIGNHGDEVRTQINFPFPVTIYGQTFTNGFVGSNGQVEFGQNTGGFNFTLPNASFGVLLCIWQRDQTTSSGGTGIFTTTIGSSPNRTFIIEWRNITFSGNGGTANYELKLFENSTSFEFLYTTSTANTSGCIGVQSAAGTASTIFSNSTTLPAANTRLIFTPTAGSNPGGWFIGAVPPYLVTSSTNKEEGNYMIQDIRIANVARPLSYFREIYKIGILPTSLSSATQYYKLRAYDLACSTPTPVVWVDTSVSLDNAPAFPCGGPYSDVEVLDTWFG